MPSHIKLIVGLGNPGPKYTDTRHNAGFWFVDELIGNHNTDFSPDKKFLGDCARLVFEGVDCRILKPNTFMNNSGRSVKAITDYYSIEPSEVLVAHDEIDLEVGTARIKKGGGHGGHNGLRDIIEQTGDKEFLRLRIGVGHPGHKDDVINYVLEKPRIDDEKDIKESIDRAVGIMPLMFKGELNKAMTLLNAPNKNRDQEPK
ncbi:MAG: aminoacyl-tRNA hydrolase [Gammaproteobacteria bacterium]